jgi:peroxiredoxin
MKRAALITMVLGLLSPFCFAAKDTEPDKQEPAPKKTAVHSGSTDSSLSYETDKQGRRLNMDFSMDLKSVSDPDLLFRHFASRNLMIFYFSSKCRHCQVVLPDVQKLVNELEPEGVSALAIAVKNNTEDDIRNSIRRYNLTMPVFHDSHKRFSSCCGTGRIPLVITVNREGQYVRFKNFENPAVPGLIKKFFASSTSNQ